VDAAVVTTDLTSAEGDDAARHTGHERLRIRLRMLQRMDSCVAVSVFRVVMEEE
jgi:hypothetical protein